MLNTGEKLFQALVPYLILLASLLLALQNSMRAWLNKRIQAHQAQAISPYWSIPLIFLAAIYGGYFGAGLSVIVLSALALVFDDSLTKLNALKQAIAFCVNVAAAVFFLFFRQSRVAGSAVYGSRRFSRWHVRRQISG